MDDVGKRSLVEAFINDEEIIGKFWGVFETHPYMRYLVGAASCLWTLDKLAEAEDIYHHKLALNHKSNQGVCFELQVLLIVRVHYEDALRLMKEYEDDYGVDWAYYQTLLDFQAWGPTKNCKMTCETPWK